MAGVMLAVFALLAAWRERLAGRVSGHPGSEAPDRSRLDEAIRHALVAVLACVVGAGISMWASATANPPEPGATAVAPTHVAVLAYAWSAYVAGLIVAIVVLTYDAYTDAIADIESEHGSQLTDQERSLFSTARRARKAS